MNINFLKIDSKKIDNIFIRDYVIFFLILIFCTSGLIYILITGDRQIGKINKHIEDTQLVIVEAGQVAVLIEGMVSAQQGYIITNNKKFMHEYENKRSALSYKIGKISQLLVDNKEQVERVDEIRSNFIEFSARLENRAPEDASLPTANQLSLTDLEAVNRLRENMMKLNDLILKHEYGLLSYSVNQVNKQKGRYFVSLLVGLVISPAMLLLFNGFLLHAQRRTVRIAASLKDTETRFALAAEGTQDGIFDWDIEKGEVFYSKAYFGMLGYNKEAFVGSINERNNLIHPEDVEKVNLYVRNRLEGKIVDYAQEFRMRHKDGTWIWIQSRAKAMFDDKGKAIRMVGAHTNISHIKKEQERLETEKKEAEDANKAKGDFLAHMSHEIRTPLTAISGVAEIFEKNQNNLTDTQKKLIHTLYLSTSALKDLINDILDFSKIESGELELIEECFDLEVFFNELTSMMAMRAVQKGLTFKFDISSVKDINFIGDKLRIRQVLVNLIGNALKFTSKGSVMITAYEEEVENRPYLRIDVSDTGIGIAPEKTELIFERFKQADASGSRKYGGTGLGLAISRNLAELMEGTILLRSELGKGSIFSLLVPRKSEGNKISNIEDTYLISKLNERIRMSLNENSKVLLVEDYEGNIVVIGHFLQELGFSYDIAINGVLALELWRSGHYDIILMDIQMPEMDGFSVTRKIRRLEKENNLPRTPIIGMTAHALIEDKAKCIASGMDAYLPKPIVEKDLKLQIFKYLHLGRKAA